VDRSLTPVAAHALTPIAVPSVTEHRTNVNVSVSSIASNRATEPTDNDRESESDASALFELQIDDVSSTTTDDDQFNPQRQLPSLRPPERPQQPNNVYTQQAVQFITNVQSTSFREQLQLIKQFKHRYAVLREARELTLNTAQWLDLARSHSNVWMSRTGSTLRISDDGTLRSTQVNH
jgi:hypothetical protein